MRAFAFALLLTACASAPPKSSTITPIFPTAQGGPRALEKKSITEASGQPRFDVSLGARRLRIGEGKWKIAEENPGWNQMYGWGPVVWVIDKGAIRVLDLRAEFPSYYVSHVFSDPGGKRVFVFLEYGIEGPAPSYIVWTTADNGETWSRGADLPRPPGEFPPSQLESFHLDAEGRGTALLKLEASNLAPEKRGGIPARADVFYRVHTPDGGRSWQPESEPAFTSVLRAEEEKHP